MSDAEKDVIAMYDQSRPEEDKLYNSSSINQLAWSLLVIAVGVLIWMSLALINAENQRNAYASNACPDPLFKGAVDAKCMKYVATREHWWQHLTYAMTHLRP